MALSQTLEIFDLLDHPRVDGAAVAEHLRRRGLERVEVQTVRGEQGATDFVRVVVPGTAGRLAGGGAPTLGVIGRLGGIGARPERIGMVSDGDGAAALKLGDMAQRGDRLPGDVILVTHICPCAPVRPHQPVPFMGAPVTSAVMNRHEVEAAMEAILSIDTTRGNRLVNRRGIAITPTVKEGYILRTSEDLLDILQWVTGQLPSVLPLTTQDITPYGNGLFHINSILQPAAATAAPVVGVALTAETAVPGCATGASHAVDIELAVRFALEVAKAYGAGQAAFFDAGEFARIVGLYGSMRHLQTQGQGI